DRAWVEGMHARFTYRLEDSIAAFDRAIAAWPEDPRAHVGAAFLYAELWADAEGGRPYLEKAVRVPTLPHPAAILYLLLLGKNDEALARARRWIEERPSRATYGFLSVVHRVRGETAESLAAARRGLALGDQPPR